MSGLYCLSSAMQSADEAVAGRVFSCRTFQRRVEARGMR